MITFRICAIRKSDLWYIIKEEKRASPFCHILHPSTFRPLSVHIPSTIRPHSVHIPSTVRPHSVHIPSTFYLNKSRFMLFLVFCEPQICMHVLLVLNTLQTLKIETDTLKQNIAHLDISVTSVWKYFGESTVWKDINNTVPCTDLPRQRRMLLWTKQGKL